MIKKRMSALFVFEERAKRVKGRKRSVFGYQRERSLLLLGGMEEEEDGMSGSIQK